MQSPGVSGGRFANLSGFASDEAMRQIDDSVELAIRRHELFSEAERRIEQLTVTEQSPDSVVRVTVRSSGALVSLELADVAQTQQPMDRVVSAVKVATPNGFDLAYGTACQGIAVAMRPVREWAEDVAGKLSNCVESATDQLIKGVDEYDKTEQKNAKELRAIAADLPANDKNWVVADGTKFDLGSYIPAKGGFLAKWDKPEDKVAGAGAWENSVKLFQEVTGSSKRNYGLILGHAASLGLDGLSAANDPIGTSVGWVAGWAMEHIKPLKLMLDMLAGNPDMIKGAAQTWKNVGDELIRLGHHYDKARKAGTGGWHGDAGEAYDTTAKIIVDALLAKGSSRTR